MKPSDNLQRESDRVVEQAENSIEADLTKEKALLDSIYKVNLISSENYQLYNTQLIYKKKLFELYKINGGPDKRVWQDACDKYDLTDNSYIVITRFTSRQFEEMNINFIPHYILYDKKGQPVHENAPRPDNDYLLKLIDKYLAEK